MNTDVCTSNDFFLVSGLMSFVFIFAFLCFVDWSIMCLFKFKMDMTVVCEIKNFFYTTFQIICEINFVMDHHVIPSTICN